MAYPKSPAYSSRYTDTEAQEEDAEDIKLNRQIRHGFIRKVYGIVCTQLTFTAAVALFFTFYEPARVWITTSTAAGVLMLLCAVIALGIGIVLCFKDLTTKYPGNYIILAVFTGCMAFSVGGACGSSATVAGGRVVLMALIATGVITLGLTLFAFQTKYDFTSCMGVMFVILLGFMVFGLIKLFFPSNKTVEIVYASVGAAIFAFYIIIDTQLIIGSGKISIDEEQYILAAITLYLDIINLFLYILRIITETRRD